MGWAGLTSPPPQQASKAATEPRAAEKPPGGLWGRGQEKQAHTQGDSLVTVLCK